MSPFFYTADEFASLLFSKLGRGVQQAKSLYSCFIREGAIRKDLPPFKNAPCLYQEMESFADWSVLPHIVLGEEGDAVRFALKTEDNRLIESVVMKMQHGNTLCVSCQIGCRMGCRFCCTGKSGFVRNLTSSEIVQQLFVARHILHKDVKNIVFMGMGEAFDTREALFQAVAVFSDPLGFNIGMKHITISTSGDIQGILSMASALGPMPNLALSLNATSDILRANLMPYRKKETLPLLKGALQHYCVTKKKEVLISYVLLKGVNDTLEHAEKLCSFLEGIPAKINIIPFNSFPGTEFQEPDSTQVSLFVSSLRKHGFRVLLRGRKGSAIQAACGQLQLK